MRKVHTHRSQTGLVLIMVVILIIIAALVFSNRNSGPVVTEQTATTTPPTGEQGMVVTTKTIKENNKLADYLVIVSYPQFDKMSNSDAEIRINKDVQANIDAVIKDFKNSVGDITDNIPGGEQSTLDVSYNIQSNNTIPNILSMKLVESTFLSGAAHPGQYIETWNYNTNTGRNITLDDIFTNNSYLGRLSTYTRNALKQKLGNDGDLSSQIEQGTTADEDNFASFLVTDTGLDIIFQEYQVAAYAAGVQEVIVPYSQLRDIINPNGPLGFILSR